VKANIGVSNYEPKALHQKALHQCVRADPGLVEGSKHDFGSPQCEAFRSPFDKLRANGMLSDLS